MPNIFFTIKQKIIQAFSRLLFTVIDTPAFRAFARPIVKAFKFKSDVAVKVNGSMMYANRLDMWLSLVLYSYSSNEAFETELFEKIIKSNMTVADVGANLGYFTITFSRCASKGKVYAFEPDPVNFRLLQKTIHANKLKNVVAVNKAVSDKNGTTKLFICEEHSGDHRIFDSSEYSGEKRSSIPIDTISLDSFFENNNEQNNENKSEKSIENKSESNVVDVIKMDIQGAEYMALKGMLNLLKQNKDLVLISEFSPLLIKQSGHEPKLFLEELESLGFKILYINSNRKRLEKVPSEFLLNQWQGKRDINLLVSRKIPESVRQFVL